MRGFDARTGELLWTFHTVPQPGEFGNETWEEESWKRYGGANVWAPMSADLDLGYAYLPISAPSHDFYGGERPGDNLFSETLACVDCASGRRIWHYQLIHHGIWDYDVASAPILMDVSVDGRPVKAVVQLTKQAFAFVFDRVTGEPLWPVEERPVPQSSVPGERPSPTQPFPTRPLPFDRQGFGEEDLIDFTPELREQALRIAETARLRAALHPSERTGHLDPAGWRGRSRLGRRGRSSQRLGVRSVADGACRFRPQGIRQRDLVLEGTPPPSSLPEGRRGCRSSNRRTAASPPSTSTPASTAG